MPLQTLCCSRDFIITIIIVVVENRFPSFTILWRMTDPTEHAALAVDADYQVLK
jgi:hypothetical protein